MKTHITLLTTALILAVSCSEEPKEVPVQNETVTSEEINHNIMNTEKWNQYDYNDQTVLFFYCGDTSEVSTNETRLKLSEYIKSNANFQYLEFYTDEYNSLASINDTMFFDMNELFKQDGFLLLKKGSYEIINIATPLDSAIKKVDNFFQINAI
jgi:hypothetical protein